MIACNFGDFQYIDLKSVLLPTPQSPGSGVVNRESRGGGSSCVRIRSPEVRRGKQFLLFRSRHESRQSASDGLRYHLSHDPREAIMRSGRGVSRRSACTILWWERNATFTVLASCTRKFSRMGRGCCSSAARGSAPATRAAFAPRPSGCNPLNFARNQANAGFSRAGRRWVPATRRPARPRPDSRAERCRSQKSRSEARRVSRGARQLRRGVGR